MLCTIYGTLKKLDYILTFFNLDKSSAKVMLSEPCTSIYNLTATLKLLE